MKLIVAPAANVQPEPVTEITTVAVVLARTGPDATLAVHELSVRALTVTERLVLLVTCTVPRHAPPPAADSCI
jgi:hypothetical protein